MEIPIQFIESQPVEIPVGQRALGFSRYASTRKQAVADGQQIDVTKIAREAGIGIPTFITRAVFERYVAGPAGVPGQNEAKRLRDLLGLVRIFIQRSSAGLDRQTARNQPKPMKLAVICSPLDIEDRQPALTLMLPEEV